MRAYTEALPYARDITAKIASGALRLFSGGQPQTLVFSESQLEQALAYAFEAGFEAGKAAQS